jgi:hypothetical protein
VCGEVMKSSKVICRAALLLVGLTLTALVAQAQEHWGGGGHPGGPGPGPGGAHYDTHYNHNHYYADRGAYYGAVPGHPLIIAHPGGNYYYSGGVWYAPRGPGFVVVGAPIGVFVPILPPYYSTLWIGGAPYYYANDTYYAWSADQGGYQVVAPPSDPNATSPPPQSDQLYVYPENGQTAEQQASDKYDCHKWATSQTGFDPTQNGGGVPPDQTGDKNAAYQRAISACLVGRGYSVR